MKNDSVVVYCVVLVVHSCQWLGPWVAESDQLQNSEKCFFPCILDSALAEI